jgi:anti-sigma28 factor (negative regulator of flagellin synthesis)
MQVNKPAQVKTGDALRPIATSKTSTVSPATAQPPHSHTVGGRTPRTDHVEISDVGRSLADASLGVRAGVSWESAALDSDRINDIRARIASGAYLSSEVADMVARAILARGDL